MRKEKDKPSEISSFFERVFGIYVFVNVQCIDGCRLSWSCWELLGINANSSSVKQFYVTNDIVTCSINFFHSVVTQN